MRELVAAVYTCVSAAEHGVAASVDFEVLQEVAMLGLEPALGDGVEAFREELELKK